MPIWFRSIDVYTYLKLSFHYQDNRDAAPSLDFGIFCVTLKIAKGLITLFLKAFFSSPSYTQRLPHKFVIHRSLKLSRKQTANIKVSFNGHSTPLRCHSAQNKLSAGVYPGTGTLTLCDTPLGACLQIPSPSLSYSFPLPPSQLTRFLKHTGTQKNPIRMESFFVY